MPVLPNGYSIPDPPELCAADLAESGAGADLCAADGAEPGFLLGSLLLGSLLRGPLLAADGLGFLGLLFRRGLQLGDAGLVLLDELLGGGDDGHLAQHKLVLRQEVVFGDVGADLELGLLDGLLLLLVLQRELALLGQVLALLHGGAGGLLALLGQILALFHGARSDLLQTVSQRHDETLLF